MLDHVLTTMTCIRRSSLIISTQREQRIRRAAVLACFDLWETNGCFVFILRRLDFIEKSRMDNALTLFIRRLLFVMVGFKKYGHENRLKRDLG